MSGRPRAIIVSRQRLIGATNGSSAYLIDLARSIRTAGLEPVRTRATWAPDAAPPGPGATYAVLVHRRPGPGPTSRP